MSGAATIPPDLDVDLGGLCAEAAPWLARLPVADQRVRAVPDERTLRFYQSSGLMDRPVRYEGRVARYGARHLLQVLAVRVLQAQGHSLAQVQGLLSGATDAELRALVFEALGAPQAPRPLTPPPTALVAAELAPGLILTVDPRLHPDPARLIELLRAALNPITPGEAQ